MLAIPVLMSPILCLRELWFRTQRAAVANRRATNLATHLPYEQLLLFLEEDSPYGRPTFYSDSRRENNVETEERPLVDIIRQFLQANISKVEY